MSGIYKINIGYFKNLKEDFKKNQATIILTLFLIIGTAIGSVITEISENPDGISGLFNQYINSKNGQGLSAAFLSSFFSILPYLIISFLLGQTSFGHFTGWLILFFRGLGFGATASYLYLAYDIAGVAYCALIFAPTAIISTLILIMSGTIAGDMSKRISKMYQKGSRCLSMHSDFSEYCAKHFKYLLILTLNSVLDALLNMIFYKFFELK